MLPQNQAIYALQSPVDQAITRIKAGVKGKEGDQLKQYVKRELSFIQVIGSLQDSLEAYKKDARKMTSSQRESEVHNSDRLGRNMRASGLAKPAPNWEAHAIISGGHGESAVLRAILAIAMVRIDDPDNGAWLPKSLRDAMGTVFPKAVVHGRIHRWHYYRWLERKITMGMSEPELRLTLREIRHRLQTSSFPKSVMKKKNEK